MVVDAGVVCGETMLDSRCRPEAEAVSGAMRPAVHVHAFREGQAGVEGRHEKAWLRLTELRRFPESHFRHTDLSGHRYDIS